MFHRGRRPLLHVEFTPLVGLTATRTKGLMDTPVTSWRIALPIDLKSGHASAEAMIDLGKAATERKILRCLEPIGMLAK